MTTYRFWYPSGRSERRRLSAWLTRQSLRAECIRLGAVAWGEDCDA